VDDIVTCGLTACTPGSAPGPTLGKRVWEAFTFLLEKCVMSADRISTHGDSSCFLKGSLNLSSCCQYPGIAVTARKWWLIDQWTCTAGSRERLLTATSDEWRRNVVVALMQSISCSPTDIIDAKPATTVHSFQCLTTTTSSKSRQSVGDNSRDQRDARN